MTQIQVNLSDDAARFVEQQVATGKFASPSDVLADALEQVRTQVTKSRLAELVREGLEHRGEDSEYSDEWYEQWMDELDAEAERRSSA
jgi:Arc/MetJ-type ribon-helix-helix transcriptional regulator